MKTKEFISINLDTKPKKDRYCSSVMQSTNGNFYSYGYHYPLLFKIGDKWLVNDMGYSSSTNKHIYWAFNATPNALPIQLPNYINIDLTNKEKLADIVRSTVHEIKREMNSKKRKDTKIYANLQYQYNRYFQTLIYLADLTI